jgi:Na+-translocating ferredoxin:NAD+ oxidoreductase RNF subunit RnfB
MESITLISIFGFGGMGALLSLLLVIANNRLYVPDDPLLAKVKEALPSTNCGGCGYAGCGQFAEKLVTDGASPNGCAVLSDDGKIELAGILGRSIDIEEKRVAKVMCAGGIGQAKLKGHYTGARSCIASRFASSGNKLCEYGCVGFGDCVKSCPFDAMYMDENELPVIVQERCTGCGICVVECPKSIIELHPVSRTLFVLCKNRDINKEAKRACSVSCTACGLCTNEADGAITIEENLAIIHYDLMRKIKTAPDCPRNCFTDFIAPGGFAKKTEELVSV